MICVARPTGSSGSSPGRAARILPVSASFATCAPAAALDSTIWAGAFFQVTCGVSASFSGRCPLATPENTSNDPAQPIASMRTYLFIWPPRELGEWDFNGLLVRQMCPNEQSHDTRVPYKDQRSL